MSLASTTEIGSRWALSFNSWKPPAAAFTTDTCIRTHSPDIQVNVVPYFTEERTL